MTGRDLGVAKLSAVQQGCLEHASDFNLTYQNFWRLCTGHSIASAFLCDFGRASIERDVPDAQ